MRATSLVARTQKALWSAVVVMTALAFVAIARGPAEVTPRPVAVLHTAVVIASTSDSPPPPRQDLQPGETKHPGERCATTVQPPENQGCPGRPNDTAWCRGSGYQIGECLAAERAFFNPPSNFQPRNRTEACISQRENGNSYSRSSNPGHMGRWQDTESLYRDNGGQNDWNEPPSPAEQDMVFVNIVAKDGYSPWTPYDKC